MSIALEVCRMAEERVGRGVLPRLRAVGLRVGTEAGVEAESLEFCLEALLAHPPFDGARPEVERCGGDVLQLEYLVLEDEGGDEGEVEGEGGEGGRLEGEGVEP